jgi:uncharacterized peroxidase-related enzyme
MRSVLPAAATLTCGPAGSQVTFGVGRSRAGARLPVGPVRGHNGEVFIRITGEADATGALAAYYQQQRETWGFLPNYAAAFAPRPHVAQAWNALNGAIREGMDRRRYELATIAAARALRSTYCTAAHASFLRDVCADETTLHVIAADPSGAGLGAQDGAIFRFATKLATNAASITVADVDELRSAGLSDPEIADVVYAVAARSFFTRVLDGLGAQLDAQTAASFAPELLATMLVGRPVATPSAAP